MSKIKNPTPLEQLNNVINKTVFNISKFKRKPGDFTRNRKLNAATTIKTVLNMQGNSINTELIEAFPDIDDRMTAPKLLNNKYRVYAIDGSDSLYLCCEKICFYIVKDTRIE